jgi:hypothetical protein
MFGSTKAPSFEVDSESEITATSPPGTGSVDVTVKMPGGTSPTNPADLYTYGASSESPNSRALGAQGTSAGSKGLAIKDLVHHRKASRAQEFAKALKACNKEPKRKRAACEKNAKKKYGALGKHTSGKRKLH